MKRRPVKRGKPGGAPKWMVTYSDMVTLILVFFILLFSMSQIDLVKFEAISDSFKNRMIFDFYPSPIPMENPTENTSDLESQKNANEIKNPTQLDDAASEKEDTLDELMKAIKAYLDKNNLNNVISASRNERGVVLILQELILFDSGEAEILATGEPFLNKIGSLLTEIPNEVKVEGHTDSRPISSFRYPSNWELSGARAGSVVRYLIKENKFVPSRFTIVGYGDTRPLVPNNSIANMSKNRRVEIVILENENKKNS